MRVTALLLVLATMVMWSPGCSDEPAAGEDATSDLVTDVSQPSDLVDDGADLLADTVDETSEPLPPPEIDWTAIAEPPAEVRPWVRWWWPGGDVEDEVLAAQIASFADNGFGGAEIQAFYAALDPDVDEETLAERRSYGTAAFYSHVAAAMEAALEAGIGIDMTLGSGWATGGDHITVDESMQTLMWSEQQVEGAGATTITFDGPTKSAFYEVSELAGGMGEPMARYLPDEAVLQVVLAAEVTGGERASNPFVLTDSIELDADSVTDLTSLVDGGGSLTWDVPEGTWQIIAIYQAPDGGFVNLSAQSGEGFVVDHFDAGLVEDNMEELLGAHTGLDAYYGAPLRALFNDSFELKTERHVTQGFFDSFEAKRGYSVIPWLPVVLLPGADNHIFDGGGVPTVAPFAFGSDDWRIQHDYQQTVSDCFIEAFVDTSSAWAESKGLLTKLQPYGIKIDVIRAAGQAHIPEAEQLYAGGPSVLVEAIASGAHLYGRPLVSAEAMVWANRAYMTTPTKMKASADKLFAHGVNQLVYHGAPYPLDDPAYGETGWHAFCSPWSGMGTYASNISDGSPFWPWMAEVNQYVARVQGVMRLGEPSTDVLVYYPWLGVSAALGRLDDVDELLFNGQLGDLEPPAGANPLFVLVDTMFGDMDLGPGGSWLRAMMPGLATLEGHGYSWDWVNDHSLAEATASKGGVVIRGVEYRAVVVADSPTMTPEAAEALEGLAEAGVPVVMAGAPPEAQPGFFEYVTGDEAVAASMAAVDEAPSTAAIDTMDELSEALGGLNVAPFIGWGDTATPLVQERRDLGGGGMVVFVANQSLEAQQVTGTLDDVCEQAILLDPWSGTYESLGDVTSLPLSLEPLGSRLLFCGAANAPGDTFAPAPTTADDAVTIDGPWHLVVQAEEPLVSAFDDTLDTLVDWRDLPELVAAKGPGLYTTTVDLPEAAQGISVELGWVAGVARVSLDGVELGDALVPPFRVTSSAPLTAGSHELTVEVTPPLFDHLVGMGDSGDPAYVEFKGKSDELIPAGLLGPVTITPLQ